VSRAGSSLPDLINARAVPSGFKEHIVLLSLLCERIGVPVTLWTRIR
jgi:hypothetical protein